MQRDENQCVTPGCRLPNGHGDGSVATTGKFCEGCARDLAKVRAEYEAEEAARKAKFASTTNGGRAKDDLWAPTCCNPYCSEERTPGQAYCDGCIAAGYVEEEEAA